MFIFAAIYVVILVALSVTLFVIERPISAAVFLALAVPFALLVFRYGSTVSFTEEGVVLRFCGIERKKIRWKDLKDVCVCGARVMNRLNKERCGTIYFIFSEKHIPENKLFDMMLKWPPKGKIYLKFTKDRLLEIQMHWQKPVQKFNIGSLDI